jgi:hypothetical protein
MRKLKIIEHISLDGVIPGQLKFSAPKARNVRAWGNAPGHESFFLER